MAILNLKTALPVRISAFLVIFINQQYFAKTSLCPTARYY